MTERPMTVGEIVTMSILGTGFLVSLCGAIENRGLANMYHTKLCAEWLADATTPADTLTVYLEDRFCLPETP